MRGVWWRANARKLEVGRQGAMRILVSGLGLVGIVFVVFGAVLLGVGLLSTPDSWGFSRAVAAFGFMGMFVGAILYLMALTNQKRKP